MPPFVSDTFTDSDDVELSAHVGETGATWVEHPNSAAPNFIHTANRVRPNSTGTSVAFYYASGLPASADYDVECPVHFAGARSFAEAYLFARLDPAAHTYYRVICTVGGGVFNTRLQKVVAGSGTFLSDAIPGAAILAGETHVVKLEPIGTAIKVYEDGVERISATDSDIASAGRAGVGGRAADATSGLHIASIVANDLGAPPAAANRGRALTGAGA